MENKKSEPFLEMPYAKRQLIVVVDDHVVEAERAARAPKTAADNKLDWADVFKKSLFYSAAPAIALGVEVVKAVRDKGVNVFPVSISESAAIQFPPGHPRDRVLYIGHPAIREIYYPAAQFHQLTFEHKFLEAIELLMALGAVKIKVEHQSGWGREFSTRLNIPEFIKMSVGGHTEQKRRLLFQTSSLPGTLDPSVPDELIWYSHEPTWQQVARGRIKYGMKDFSLRLQYEDDFGVNANLAVKAKNANLDFGGEFKNHESTIWNIHGKWKE